MRGKVVCNAPRRCLLQFCELTFEYWQTALLSNLKSSLAPKIHDTLIWGNRHFALFPGRFSKDIWEAKLFGVAENIVWRRSGRLNLKFWMSTALFFKFEIALGAKNPQCAHIGIGCFPVVFLRTYERQSCSEWVITLFSVGRSNLNFECQRLYFQIWNRLFGAKTTIRTYGKSPFCTVSRSFF